MKILKARKNQWFKKISWCLSAWCLAGSAMAIDLTEDGSLTVTGFYNITAGKVISGSSGLAPSGTWNYQQWKCPCSIQNWEYVGVYEKSKGWQLDQESLVGVQFNKKFNSSLSATAQIISRPTTSNSNTSAYIPSIDWAYMTYKPEGSDFEIQAGRKRIPLYYYSDFLYIGYSYPWVRPSADVYGWPIYSYDGVNVSYNKEVGSSGWSVGGNVWFGSRKQNNNAYDTKIYNAVPTSESWDNMKGIYLTASNGIVEMRLMEMIYRDNQWQEPFNGAPKNTLINNQFTRIKGLAVNVDWNNWLVRSEIDRFEQNPYLPNRAIYNYALMGVGYHFDTPYGGVTPILTYSQYKTSPNTATYVEGRKTWSLGTRWDFKPNMALKIQVDSSKDQSQYPYPFFGDSKMISVSLQGVF